MNKPLTIGWDSHALSGNGRGWTLPLLLLCGDAATLATGLAVTDLLLGGPPAVWAQPAVPLLALGVMAGSTLLGHYAGRGRSWQDGKHDARDLLTLLSLAMLANLAADLAHGETTALPVTWIAGWPVLLGVRHLLRAVVNMVRPRNTPTLLIGDGQNARRLFEVMSSDPGRAFNVLHAVSQEKVLAAQGASSLRALAARHPDLTIVWAPDQISFADRQWVVDTLVRTRVPFSIVPPLNSLALDELRVHSFFGHDMVMLSVENRLVRPHIRLLKRGFDLVVAGTALAVLAPLFLVIAWQIRRDGGKALFWHERIGRGGERFKCLKFRTMVMDSQRVLQDLLARDPAARAEWERDFKLRDDPRITPIGRFLRRTSLDELPQLVNVIKGEMSLVGPRPIIAEEIPRYGQDFDFYCECPAGMTGLWQVSGRNDVSYARRVELDSWYARNWSLWLDIVIIGKTLRVLLGRQGAY